MDEGVLLSIKAARVNEGLTQEALAQKLGVSKRTIISWEKGEVDVKPLTMFALAYVLSIDVDYLRVPVKKFKQKPHFKYSEKEEAG
ncbi:MAG: orf6, phiMR25 [Sporolactobacillus laevolacticus]|jgi:putative transcriptional regulator|nr:orf6, phiMR25 [Sporolactobacillus laevolacticus]